MSVFEKYRSKAYPFRFAGELTVRDEIHGGVPSDPRTAEAWLRTKIADKDDLIRTQVAETMIERGVDAEQAARLVDDLRHLNGFRRDKQGLYINGAQLKACLKEAASVAANAGKLDSTGWGGTDNKSLKKWLTNWLPEHVFVMEDRLYLGLTADDFAAELSKNGDGRAGIEQRFVHAKGRSGIQYEEYVREAVIAFTIETDHAFTEEQWAMLWLTAGENGLGASRSRGHGRFEITKWEAMA